MGFYYSPVTANKSCKGHRFRGRKCNIGASSMFMLAVLHAAKPLACAYNITVYYGFEIGSAEVIKAKGFCSLAMSIRI